MMSFLPYLLYCQNISTTLIPTYIEIATVISDYNYNIYAWLQHMVAKPKKETYLSYTFAIL